MLDYSQLGMRRINALEFARKGVVTFLLRDEFTTADAAPITSPRTCEPGPGTLTAIQTDGQFGISGEALDVPAQSTPLWGDLGFYISPVQTRGAGLAAIWESTFSAVGASGCMIGWMNGPAIGVANFRQVIRLISSGYGAFVSGATGIDMALGTPSTSTSYINVIVLRSAGCFFVVKTGGSYKLGWVDDTESTASLYPSLSNYGNPTALTMDYYRAPQLPAPWDTDNGIATDSNIGNVTASTTMTHEADSVFEFTITTVPAAGNIDRFFRIQDASNYWIARVTNGGSLKLIEVIAGVENERGSGGTVTNGERIVIIADDDDITGYADNAQAWTYASAANFKTETAGELDSLGTGGAVQDDIVFPRTISGSALTELEKYTT